jgi:hypothetical protein
MTLLCTLDDTPRIIAEAYGSPDPDADYWKEAIRS